jgi:predicted AlkP superfamily phosphohydrolase/phosphomutase
LSAAGKRVAILDVPLSRPSPRINGIQLVEWGAHDATHGFATSPASLAAEVVARFGEHPQRGLCDADRTAAQIKAFRDGLLHGIAGKDAVTKHSFLRAGKLGLLRAGVPESHCIGHQAWHLHDRGHPRFNESDRALVGDPVLDVAVATDRALGEILADVDDDTTVVLLASHGLHRQVRRAVHAARISCSRSALRAPGELVGRSVPWKVRQVLDPVLTEIWQRTPQRARNCSSRCGSAPGSWWRPHRGMRRSRSIPLRESASVLIQGNTHGAIRVNLVGREPEGKVNPGAEYEAFIESLTRDLMEIVNVDTGRRIVKPRDSHVGSVSGRGHEHFPRSVRRMGRRPSPCAR